MFNTNVIKTAAVGYIGNIQSLTYHQVDSDRIIRKLGNMFVQRLPDDFTTYGQMFHYSHLRFCKAKTIRH